MENLTFNASQINSSQPDLSQFYMGYEQGFNAAVSHVELILLVLIMTYVLQGLLVALTRVVEKDNLPKWFLNWIYKPFQHAKLPIRFFLLVLMFFRIYFFL